MAVLYWCLLLCFLIGEADWCAATHATTASLPRHPDCGASEIHSLIEGSYTGIDQFPWTALIEYRTEEGVSKFLCSGTLINERYIVTAAHCVTKLPGGLNVHGAHLGEWDISTDVDCDQGNCAEPVIHRTIGNITVHSDYLGSKTKFLHDIALIRLASDVTFSDTVRPICLPQLNTNVGNKTLLTGWLRGNEASLSGKKRYRYANIISAENCASIYRHVRTPLQSTQLCVDMGEKLDICNEDAEGTLMQGTGSIWYLAGIPSFGPTCGSVLPSVYTNVTAYVDWIQDNIH